MLIKITPYSQYKDLVTAYNEAMERMKSGDTIIFADHDVLILSPNTLNLVEETMKAHPEYDCYCGTTNRIGGIRLLKIGAGLFKDDIRQHTKYALQVERKGTQIEDYTKPDPHHLSGFFFALRKSAWMRIGGFRQWNESKILGVDSALHQDLYKNGLKTCIMKGIYVYHWYRGGNQNTEHLA